MMISSWAFSITTPTNQQSTIKMSIWLFLSKQKRRTVNRKYKEYANKSRSTGINFILRNDLKSLTPPLLLTHSSATYNSQHKDV